MSQIVTLNVYDLSGGLAKSMSRAIIGHQVDGIWHTGIVVYNQVRATIKSILIKCRNFISEGEFVMDHLG